MTHPRRFRFGIQANTAPNGEDWAELARKVEGLGYSSLFMPDHFGEQLAPVPALMAAAVATSTLRVGALVFGNDYRHPVVLAKEMATIDVLSGGRLELGLGAGWMNTDYEQSGIPHHSAGVRVSRMEESIAVIKGLLADGSFDFSGEHYTIAGLDGLPKPVQSPHPPLIIGGGGRRVLSIAAREADIVGINPSLKSGAVDGGTAADATAAATDRKVRWVQEAAGARFDDLELNILMFGVMVTDDREATAASIAPLFGMSTEDTLEAPLALIGSHEQMADTLRERRDRWGFSYFIVAADAMDALAPVVAQLAGT